MVTWESGESHHGHRRRPHLSTAQLAIDVSRLAASIAATAARIAARREASARLVPEHADELLRRARAAHAFAEHERAEAARWARVAEQLLSRERG